MTKPRWQGLALVVLGSALFVWIGYSFESFTPVSMVDFKAVYCGARVLLEHHDPYQPDELKRIYLTQAEGHLSDPAPLFSIVTRYIYPPTAFVLTVPFAMMAWTPAHLVWMIFIASSFILAAFLMWDIASKTAPVTSGAMICVFLAGSELLLEVGNAAGISISLCVIAVWCFLRERFVYAGILCLAVSLAVKPHDAGLVWLYFLLAGGVARKRALQTLAVTAVLGLPFVLWVWQVAPHWTQEMGANLVAHSLPGADSDPGPIGLKPTGHGASLISMQTVISVFDDDPAIYNPASYLLIGLLLLPWAIGVLRTRFSPSNAWLALAAVAALSMLPTYHRQNDTRILLLTVPAFAVLWAEGGKIRWFALLVNFAGVVFTGDMLLQSLAMFAKHIGVSTATFQGRLMTLLLSRPAPLVLLVVGVFYLWAYLQRAPRRGLADAGAPGETAKTAMTFATHPSSGKA